MRSVRRSVSISGHHTCAPVARATGATAPMWSKWQCVSRMPSSVTPAPSTAATRRAASSPGSTMTAVVASAEARTR